MGNIVSEYGEDFKSAADYTGYGAPDFPDVHRAWVRREWVSGSQGLINAGQVRMNNPKLYDYGGLGHCGLFPNIPYEVCGKEYDRLAPSTINLTPTGLVESHEDQSQSTVQQEPAAQTTTVVAEASPALKVWGAITGIAILGIVVAILKP
jgi:hypothetical protein